MAEFKRRIPHGAGVVRHYAFCPSTDWIHSAGGHHRIVRPLSFHRYHWSGLLLLSMGCIAARDRLRRDPAGAVGAAPIVLDTGATRNALGFSLTDLPSDAGIRSSKGTQRRSGMAEPDCAEVSLRDATF